MAPCPADQRGICTVTIARQDQVEHQPTDGQPILNADGRPILTAADPAAPPPNTCHEPLILNVNNQIILSRRG